MEENTQNTTAKKSNIPIIVMFLGIIIILAASAAGYWYLSNKDDDTSDSNREEETEQNEGAESDESEDEDSQEEYTVNTPAEWVEDDGTYSNINLSEMNARVFFPEEEVNNPDGFAENVNILIQDAEGYDTESYNELSLAQIEGLRSEIIKSGETTLGGEDAFELEYSVSGSTYYQKYIVIDGIAYLITYTGTEGEYDTYFDEAMEIFDSFELN